MRIYLMRHGETNWNHERRLQGQSDIPLNGRGIELAEKTAEGLKDIPFDAAFSSPLNRALTTARIVAEGRGIPVVTDDRLKEINFGAGEGTYFDPAKADPGHPMHNFFCHPELFTPMEGGESIDQVRARAEEFLRERVFPLEGSCGNILIAAHGAIIRSLINRLSGIPDQDFWRIALPNCAVSTLSLENGELKVLEQSRIYYDEPVNVRP
ncbi:MAG: histidine phosphatase family protein [Roseburia sp.]|nr:histidine phosphatase family protein [Roseburia sp.]MCM1099566.1 histidine phosphatase family protein [Ruminococcus flavefaciens]